MPFDSSERKSIVRASPVDSIIEQTQAPEGQKQEWKAMSAMDIPKNAKIKIIAVIGGQGLDTSNESSLVESTFKSIYKNVDFVLISNNQSTDDIKTKLTEEMSADGYDFILPYFSSHGGTISNGGEVSEGSTKDRFIVFNGQQQMIDDIDMKAKSDAEKIISEDENMFIDPTTGKLKNITSGTQLNIDGKSYRVANDIDFSSYLAQEQELGHNQDLRSIECDKKWHCRYVV